MFILIADQICKYICIFKSLNKLSDHFQRSRIKNGWKNRTEA